MLHALILAGGSGTRLWPYSTGGLPKQLVPLFGGRTLLDLAVERAAAAVPAGNVWLGAGPGLTHPDLPPDRTVVEPAGRDTLAAIALGCARIVATDPDAVVAVLTSDHLIEPVADFAAAVRQAAGLADDRTLVTFGVVPTFPATGFGYLELGEPLVGTARRVTQFREKPAEPQPLIDRGALWNSGMFVWRARVFLDAVARFAPAQHAVVTDPALARWAELPKLSVDYGVMEPAAAAADLSVAAVPLQLGWRDVGSWPAFGDAVGRDDAGNAVDAAAALLLGSRDCVVASQTDRLVALVGCEGLVVVQTEQATLVVPAALAQRVKELQAEVARQFPDLG